jgi:hypothetical protein
VAEAAAAGAAGAAVVAAAEAAAAVPRLEVVEAEVVVVPRFAAEEVAVAPRDRPAAARPR